MNDLERLLYLPERARAVIVTRAIVALHALWIVLSRFCLPDLFFWPREFWSGVAHETVLRYGWLTEIPERALFVALLILLPIAIWSRAASILSAVLLYHFAPLEDAIIGWPGPYLRGLTVDVVALAILALSPPSRSMPSGNFRWPILLVRFAVAAQYTFSTVAKLRATGIDWFSADNISNVARIYQMIGVAPHAELVIQHRPLAFIIGAGWFVLSIGIAVAVVSRRAAAVVTPLMALAHMAAAFLFGIVWLAAPLLLVFIEFGQRTTPNSSIQRASA